jgi:predicted methyltransferase
METPPEVGVPRVILLQDLNSHKAVEGMTAGLVDIRHAAYPHYLKDLISVVQHFADVFIHGFLHVSRFPRTGEAALLYMEQYYRDIVRASP